MRSGVYTITNTITGKIYVGSSNNIRRRWNVHRYDLRNNKHSNLYLQRTYNKYGVDSLSFEVLVNCSQEFILSEEQYWINMLGTSSSSVGYNLCSVAGTTQGFKHSSETKLKMSEARKGKPKTEAHKRAMSGRIKPVEERLKLSLANKGKRPHPYTIQRTIEACSIPLEVYKDATLLHTFVSTAVAAKTLSLDTRSIFRVIKGEYKHHKGYTFKQLKNV